MASRSRTPTFAPLLFLAIAAAAACSASANSASPDSAGGGAAGDGGTPAAGKGGSAGSSGTGGPASGGAGTTGASAGASGTGAASGASGAAGAAGSGPPWGGGGMPPSTNPTCEPGIAPTLDPTAPLVTVFTTSAPPDAAAKFGGPANASLAPTIVYPSDATIVPPNINTFEIHYQPSGATTVFEVRFTNQAVDFRVYTGCAMVGGGCVLALDKPTWSQLTAAAAGQGPLQLTVRATDGAGTGGVGTSAPRTFEIAPGALEGGIYYWNAGAGSIVRYDFGKPNQLPENYYTAASSGTMCVGCHVISSKGNRIAVGLNAPITPAGMRVLDVATKKPLFPDQLSNFEAFSPDETEILTSDGNDLTLRDVATGVAKGPTPLVANGTMADFVPDNSGIVYAKPGAPPCLVLGPGFEQCQPGIQSASIAFLPRTATGWGTEQILVPSGMDNYYPAVSPDGATVLFNHSTANMPAGSYDAPDASLWIVPIKGGKPVALGRANGGGAASSWPKWAPQITCQGELMWFTFSSTRDYGLSITGGQTWQIWMAGFNHTKAMKGEDPSFSAFWLPFQDPKTGNHIAQWVESVKRTPCNGNGDCTTTTINGTPLTCVMGFCQ